MASRSADYCRNVTSTVTALLRAADEAQEHRRVDDAEALVDWIYALLEEDARIEAWRWPEARVA